MSYMSNYSIVFFLGRIHQYFVRLCFLEMLNLLDNPGLFSHTPISEDSFFSFAFIACRTFFFRNNSLKILNCFYLTLLISFHLLCAIVIIVAVLCRILLYVLLLLLEWNSHFLPRYWSVIFVKLCDSELVCV